MPALRAVLAIFALTLVTLVLLPLQWLAVRGRWNAQRTIPVLFHRLVCRFAGVRVHVRGAPASARPLLIAANHVSWLDISVLGSTTPLSFVAKSEVASWPLLGTFARLQRSVFVNRQRRSATGKTAAELARRLSEGDAMVLFAEGTSSDAATVLPFRTALIGAAQATLGGAENATPRASQDAAPAKTVSPATADSSPPAPAADEIVWVQPLALAYTRMQGLPLDRRTRPLVAWYGDMDLAPHLWRVLCEGAFDVEVIWGAPVPVAPGADRKALARRLEEAVRDDVTRAVYGLDSPARSAPLGKARHDGEAAVCAAIASTPAANDESVHAVASSQ